MVLRNQNGFSLFELLLVCAVSGVLFATIGAFSQPTINAFAGVIGSNTNRLNVASAMSSIQMDANTMAAIYVDNSQCYVACMVDQSSNRLYYYWDPNTTGTLRRKKEAVINPISCTNGKVFATGLDQAKTTFAMNKDELVVNLAATKNKMVDNGNEYFITGGIFPALQERSVILTEGFECATLKQGWSISNGARGSWGIVQAANNQGDYQISDALGNGAGSSTTTIQIGIDLSRVYNAHASFTYMNSGAISGVAPADTFSFSLYDGANWYTLFSDNTGTLISSPKVVTVDLSSYSLNQLNQIKFSGALKTAGSHWYVNSISVFQP